MGKKRVQRKGKIVLGGLDGLQAAIDRLEGSQLRLLRPDIVLLPSDLVHLILHLFGSAKTPDWIAGTDGLDCRTVVFVSLSGLTVDFKDETEGAPAFTVVNTSPRAVNPLFRGGAEHDIRFSCSVPTGCIQLNVSNRSSCRGLDPLMSCFFAMSPRKLLSVTSTELARRTSFSGGPVDQSFEDVRIPRYMLREYADLETVGLVPSDLIPEVHEYMRGDYLQGTGPRAGDVFALDCEMVETTAGLELARATLCDCLGRVLVDMLVRPDHEITDYLTKYSGITEDMLKDVMSTRYDAAMQIHSIMAQNSNPVIVGHSPENDLRALGMQHPLVVDTAELYRSATGYKRKLSELAEGLLTLLIQDDGHDSFEDARAALDLFYLKLFNGPTFGILYNKSMKPVHVVLASKGCYARICANPKILDTLGCDNEFAVPSGNSADVLNNTAAVLEDDDFAEMNGQAGAAGEPEEPARRFVASITDETQKNSDADPDLRAEELSHNLKTVWNKLAKGTVLIVSSCPLSFGQLTQRSSQVKRVMSRVLIAVKRDDSPPVN